MFKHSIGAVALGVCLVIGFAPQSSAQIVANPAVQDSVLIPVSAQWDNNMKFVRAGDFRRLEMGPNAEKHIRIQIGPLELESRKSTNDAPWRPYVPYFQQSHTAFSWSFDLHRSHSSPEFHQ